MPVSIFDLNPSFFYFFIFLVLHTNFSLANGNVGSQRALLQVESIINKTAQVDQ